MPDRGPHRAVFIIPLALALALFRAGAALAQFPADHRPDERGKTLAIIAVELDGDLTDASPLSLSRVFPSL